MTNQQLYRPKGGHKKYMPSEKSLSNLIPYKPGQNGHGRVYPLKERLQHALDHPLVEPKPNAPAGEWLVYQTLKAALEIVPVAFRETWDRVEGKVPSGEPAVQIDNRQIHVTVASEQDRDNLAFLRGGKLPELK